MRYMADTIVKYICEQSLGHKGILRFVLPSYPPDLLSAIGRDLEEQFARISDQRTVLRYGIAYRLGQRWKTGEPTDRASLDFMIEKGWYNWDNNLTSLRNTAKGVDDDCLVILLAGYDDIEDRASLEDFFHLDQPAVWELCLKRSFYDWISACLGTYIEVENNKHEFENIANLFKVLYDHGLTDLLQVSCYLEQQDFTEAANGNDAYRLILRNLAPFRLPRMTGLARRQSSRKPLSQYISAAHDFFNYKMFLNASDRKKVKTRIDRYKEQSQNQPEEETLGSFASLEDLLDALYDYIDNRSPIAEELLHTADFIYVYDKILGYKGKGPKKETTVKSLAGLPPEVFLRALWITLADFKADQKSSLMLASEDIESITLISTSFRHDFGGDDEADGKELARGFLVQLLGGIDQFFESQLRLKLGSKSDPHTVNLESRLCPNHDSHTLAYERRLTAEPVLRFEVIIASHSTGSYRHQFQWKLPQNHQSRVLRNLCRWALRQYQQSSDDLPVFTIPYMAEISMAQDDEELCRLINYALQSEKCRMIGLLATGNGHYPSRLKYLLQELSQRYQAFLQEFEATGFFSALENKLTPLRQTYVAAYEEHLKAGNASNLGPLLMKAFMMVSDHNTNQPNWVWKEYMEGALVTPLHPALLEMIQHQHAFLCESFCTYATRALTEANKKLFALKRWERIVDLARMRSPIPVTLKDTNQVLDASSRGYGYIYLLGSCSEPSFSITSRLLLDYDPGEDEDVTEHELFGETRDSLLVKQVLMDYRNLHAYADDGLSIGVYCGIDIQPVIAGIDAYLGTILPEHQDRPYRLRLTILSDSGDDAMVMRWINAWKERGRERYAHCRISIAYRVIGHGDLGQLQRLLQGLDLDIMFFTNFIHSGTSRFELLRANQYSSSDYRKFPVLEKVFCKVTGSGKDMLRERVVSNSRFQLGALHTEIMAQVSGKPSDPKTRHAVIRYSDFQPWEKVLDSAHEHSAWVVCIDPSIDELLLKKPKQVGPRSARSLALGPG